MRASSSIKGTKEKKISNLEKIHKESDKVVKSTQNGSHRVIWYKQFHSNI